MQVRFFLGFLPKSVSLASSCLIKVNMTITNAVPNPTKWSMYFFYYGIVARTGLAPKAPHVSLLLYTGWIMMLSPAYQQQRHSWYLDLRLRQHSSWPTALSHSTYIEGQGFAHPWVIKRPPSFSRPCGLPADLHDDARLSRSFIIGFHFIIWGTGITVCKASR